MQDIVPYPETPEEFDPWVNYIAKRLFAPMFKLFTDHITPTFIDMVDRVIERRVAKFINITFTVKQVAEIFGESEETIYKWHQRKKLVFRKVEGRMVISLREINEQLAKQKKRTL